MTYNNVEVKEADGGNGFVNRSVSYKDVSILNFPRWPPFRLRVTYNNVVVQEADGGNGL